MRERTIQYLHHRRMQDHGQPAYGCVW
jgi:hypothetical protein